jgi:SAM-dependent methyltransferase
MSAPPSEPDRPAAPLPPVASSSPLVELAQSRPLLDSPSRFRRLARLYRRLVLRSQRHHDDHQRRVNVALAEMIDRIGANATEIAASAERESADITERLRAMEAQTEQRDSSLADAIAGINQEVRDLAERTMGQTAAVGDQLRAWEGDASRDLGRLTVALQQLADQMAALQRRTIEIAGVAAELHAVPYMSDPSLTAVLDDEGRPAIGYRQHTASAHEPDPGGFQELFRGEEQFIRERMRPYLMTVRDHEPVLDFGCGRGEMLDLLAGEGIDAYGIDIDPSMVERCQAKGRTVVLGDGLVHLAGLPDDSLGTIFAAQVVEHLPADMLREFLREARRVLRADGILVAETVNPHSVQAFRTFWTDPTHQGPIFPEVAVTLCREAGFEQAIVIFPNGCGELDRDRRSQGEYAVLARKKTA